MLYSLLSWVPPQTVFPRLFSFQVIVVAIYSMFPSKRSLARIVHTIDCQTPPALCGFSACARWTVYYTDYRLLFCEPSRILSAISAMKKPDELGPGVREPTVIIITTAYLYTRYPPLCFQNKKTLEKTNEHLELSLHITLSVASWSLMTVSTQNGSRERLPHEHEQWDTPWWTL